MASAEHVVPGRRRRAPERRQRSPLSSPDLCTAALPRLSPPRVGVRRFAEYLCRRMDNSGKEAEAMALLAEAERKVKNSQSFFSGLFG